MKNLLFSIRSADLQISIYFFKMYKCYIYILCIYRKQPKNFTYDHCFWSFVDTDPHYASKSKLIIQ